MFTEMVQRSEQLFFSPVDSSDDRLFHLPSFLEALSSIVKEMEEVTHFLSPSFPLSPLPLSICLPVSISLSFFFLVIFSALAVIAIE